MSTSKDKLTKKVAAQTGGTAAPTPRAGSAPKGTNKYGDLLQQKFVMNKQQSSRSMFTGRPNPAGGNPRAGQQYQTGTTKDGRVVHFYENGSRIVLNKKADTTLKRS